MITALVSISGCAPSGTAVPAQITIDVDATVELLVETNVAGTLTAIPTLTPLPTATRLPTDSPVPTQESSPTATPAQESFPWGCAPEGRVIAAMEFNNRSTQQVYAVLNSDICHREFTMGPGDTSLQQVPAGSYSYYGYIGQDVSFGGQVSLSDNIHTWILDINNDDAQLSTP